MNDRTLTKLSSKISLALAVLGLIVISTIVNPTHARSCGMNKSGHWGPPMHGPTPYGVQKGQAYKGQNQPSRPGMMPRGNANVVAVTKAGGVFSTLLTAVEQAGLTGLLQGKGPYTLLAPTNDAFNQLPEGALQELLADKEKLTAILKYHVLPGRVSAVDILQQRELKTASGQPLPTSDIRVIRADIPASNGIIHAVESVLLPKS